MVCVVELGRVPDVVSLMVIWRLEGRGDKIVAEEGQKSVGVERTGDRQETEDRQEAENRQEREDPGQKTDKRTDRGQPGNIIQLQETKDRGQRPGPRGLTPDGKVIYSSPRPSVQPSDV